MKFGYTIAYVRDVGETVEFWEQAFGLKRRFVGENNEYGELETGETTLAFASNELGESNLPSGFRKNDPSEPPAGVEIAPSAEDVEGAFHAALEAGATKEAEPKTKPWVRPSPTCATLTACSSRSAVRCSTSRPGHDHE